MSYGPNTRLKCNDYCTLFIIQSK